MSRLAQRSRAVVTSTILAASCGLPFGCQANTPAAPLPSITVSADYRGASAQVVADTVAAPIEREINGVEQMRYMHSHSANDGSYVLTITFEENVDLDVAQVLVQNRVSLAIPRLPDVVRQAGVTTKKASRPVAFVIVSSPDGTRDLRYLGNYAHLSLTDTLARTPGVGEVTVIGRRESAMRIHIDPEKLAAAKLATSDVMNAIREQNIAPAFDVSNSGITLNTGNALQTDAEKIAAIVIKTENDNVIRLRDVARIESHMDRESGAASFNGRSAVILCVAALTQAQPDKVSAAVTQQLKELSANAPSGVECRMAFDFAQNMTARGKGSTPEYLRLDLQLPDAASAGRTDETVNRACALLQKQPGIENLLAVRGRPFSPASNAASILIELKTADGKRPQRTEIVRDLRERTRREITGAMVSVRDLTTASDFPFDGDNLRLLVEDRGDLGITEMIKEAEQIAEDLRKDTKLTDVSIGPSGRFVPQLHVDIDREKAKRAGVSLSDIYDVIQSAHSDPIDIQQLNIRDAKGEIVPIRHLVTIKDISEPVVVERFNLFPAVEITIDAAPDDSPAEGAKRCDKRLKAAGLPKGIAVEWLPASAGHP